MSDDFNSKNNDKSACCWGAHIPRYGLVQPLMVSVKHLMYINTWNWAADHWFCPMNHKHSRQKDKEIYIFSDCVFESGVDVKKLLISFFSRCPLAVWGQGKSCIHQDYAHVAEQELSIYSEHAKMIAITSDTPHPVLSFENGSWYMNTFHLLKFCCGELGLN